jgi:hypothetical protein
LVYAMKLNRRRHTRGGVAEKLSGWVAIESLNRDAAVDPRSLPGIAGTSGIAAGGRDRGGSPRTVNRQAWTLSKNALDLQIRLRGWVVSPERGHYALSPAARERLGMK